MNRHLLWRAAAAAVMASATIVAISQLLASAQSARPSQSRVALTRRLPALDGTALAASLVEVTYGPGGANPSHRHPCPVIGYVLEGHMRMQIDGQPARIYGPGETFYESPDDVHRLSANASDEHPARFLAFFVCDRDTPLSIPVPGKGAQ